MYQRVKGQLADELGLDPGPGLRQLEQLILIQDSSLGGPPLPTGVLGRPAGNLPSMTAELIGRESDAAALLALLADHRLVEVVGPGGIGKTALAVATGRSLASSEKGGTDGIWLARLETASTADDVVDTLIAALKLPGGEPALLERLKGTTALVILDNCEHVLDAAAALAVRLLDAAPRLRVLCTSQARLDIDGETVLELAPLPISDAVALFTRRAAAQRLRPRANGTDTSVLDLCRSLDGLPLAIELAAARTKTLSIEEITRRLDERFTVLSDPASRKPERRRSLKSTIRWSYELLFPDDQRGLWALATFTGGASLPAMEFVLIALDVPAAAAIDIVGRLASRSLVIVDDAAPESSSGTPATGSVTSVRYRLLDSIRAFALEAMTDAGLSERALAAHAAWFAEAASVSTAGVRSGGQAAHLSFARAERANIDAALAWSATHEPLLALHIANGFGWAWVVLGDSRGAQRILTALEAAGNAGQPRDVASALLLSAWIEASTGRLEPARDHIAAASRLADAINDVDLQARCCYYLAYVVSHHGEFGRAVQLTDRASALYDGLDQPWDQTANCLFAARAAISAGDQQRSHTAVDQVQGWLRAVEDPWLHVRGDAVLGEFARLRHQFDDAVRHIGRAAETSRRLGFQQTEAYQVTSLGRAHCQAGDYETGAVTLESAVEKAEAAGDPRLAALARVHLGRVLRALGRLPAARSALEAATVWHRDVGGGEQAALGECLLAAMDATDHAAGAEERLRAILGEAGHRNDAPVLVLALDALARLAVEAADTAAARDLLQEADRLMSAASHFITDLDRTDAESIRAMV
jgi:predicted ATPase